MAEMPFVSSLVQEDLPVWQQCLDTGFLRRMENGTLDEACFKGYIVEDSLYLREYAKVFAWGMTKARTIVLPAMSIICATQSRQYIAFRQLRTNLTATYQRT